MKIPMSINHPKLYPVLPPGETKVLVIPFFTVWIILGGLYGASFGAAIGLSCLWLLRKAKEKNSRAIAIFRYWYLPKFGKNYQHLLDSAKREYTG